jgi:hypothetical protein
MRFGMVCLLAALAGCSSGGGEKGGVVTGAILEGGKPWTLAPGTRLPPGTAGLRVMLFALDAKGAAFDGRGARFDPSTSTFRAEAVPAGRYRISLYKEAAREDEFNRRFSRDRSPLEVRLPATGADLVIDLDTTTVKVK